MRQAVSNSTQRTVQGCNPGEGKLMGWAPQSTSTFLGGNFPARVQAGIWAEHSCLAAWRRQRPEGGEAEAAGSVGQALEKRMLCRGGGGRSPSGVLTRLWPEAVPCTCKMSPTTKLTGQQLQWGWETLELEESSTGDTDLLNTSTASLTTLGSTYGMRKAVP